MRTSIFKDQKSLVTFALLFFLLASGVAIIASPSVQSTIAPSYEQSGAPAPQPKPAPAPARWLALIGEYGPDDNILIILEMNGSLSAFFNRAGPELLVETSKNNFVIAPESRRAGQRVIFTRDAHGRATQVEINRQVLKRDRKSTRLNSSH